jgi:transcriptional regulator with XRE-family HTH domain
MEHDMMRRSMEPVYIDKALFQTMFGICVQEARESRGLTLADLHLVTGIPSGRLRQIESGQSWVREKTRHKLMYALEITEAHEECLLNVARISFIDELTRMWWAPAEHAEEPSEINP